jgi:hypothetical protein
MANVKVKNLNVHPFSQKFKGVDIRLAAHGSSGDAIDMDYEEAVEFLGTFYPFKLDNKGNHDPKFFKMLKIDGKPEHHDAKKAEIRCPVCRELCPSWLDLEAHQRVMHQDQVLKDEEYQKWLDSKEKAAHVKATAPR